MTIRKNIKWPSQGRRLAYTGNENQLRAGRQVTIYESKGAEFSFRVKRSFKERKHCFLPQGGRLIVTTDNQIALFLPRRKLYRLEFFKNSKHLFAWIVRYLRRLAVANQLNENQKWFATARVEFDYEG